MLSIGEKITIQQFDVTIIGSGIIGLSTAYQLLNLSKSINKPKIAILEKNNVIAKQQTSHNSGVIHSGIYYKPNSLKANNCINGYQMLLEYCKKKHIPFDICGKIIVATNIYDVEQLNKLIKRGQLNGLDNLTPLTKKGILNHEPSIQGLEGLHVPQTGIIDYLSVCQSLKEDIEAHGTQVFLGSKVLQLSKEGDAIRIKTTNKTINSKMVINCAGLHSDKISRLSLSFCQDQKIKKEILNTKIIPFRGEYYKLIPQKRNLIKNLVYPVPNPKFPFLGVHFTRMMNGEIEAGPNAVLAFSREGYTKFDINLSELLETLTFPGFLKLAQKHWSMGFEEMYRSFSKTAFTKALQQMMPSITAEDLEYAPSGVRAQACTIEGQLLDDFKIIQHDNIIHVINAPSPAATSSLSIGKYIAEMNIAQ